MMDSTGLINELVRELSNSIAKCALKPNSCTIGDDFEDLEFNFDKCRALRELAQMGRDGGRVFSDAENIALGQLNARLEEAGKIIDQFHADMINQMMRDELYGMAQKAGIARPDDKIIDAMLAAYKSGVDGELG